MFELPEPDRELALRVEGGLSGALVRRPAAVPVRVAIDGGATDLRLDGDRFGAIGGVVRRHAPGAGADVAGIALRVMGGASGLTVDAGPGAG